MSIKQYFPYKFILFVISLASFSSSAAIVINGTRVIYPSDVKEKTVRLTNKGDVPVLVQSWLDNGDQRVLPENITTPFVLTPPINRIDPGKAQALRITFAGSPLSKEHESLYWLNVLEIPASAKVSPDQNMMKFAVRTRIKLFYRPHDLSFIIEDVPESLVVSADGSGVKIFNPSPYYVSLASVNVIVDGKEYSMNGGMIGPNSSGFFEFENLNHVPRGADINLNLINDYGAVNKVNVKVG
ncbi:fimbrial biogenesis chaperone [Shewanella mangrovisoli]|uniref:fimbrial biogenesis chaperone n=1 Tax=Shewanella mangrovisoli TaxID=2864211 RepID=UPI0035B739EE